jgi:hypothetical protein
LRGLCWAVLRRRGSSVICRTIGSRLAVVHKWGSFLFFARFDGFL